MNKGMIVEKALWRITLIIPIRACYYSKLRNAIKSGSRVQFLLTKI